MKLSENGIRFIKREEGEVLKGYLDSKGLLTIGVGHLVLPGEPYKLGVKITKEESDRLFRQDAVRFEECVNNVLLIHPIAQNKFDAMVSLAFNIGEAGFKRSRVLQFINKGNVAKAADAFYGWVKPPELKGRRTRERNLFLTPDKISTTTSASSLRDVSSSEPTPLSDQNSEVADPSSESSSNVFNSALGKINSIGDKFQDISATFDKVRPPMSWSSRFIAGFFGTTGVSLIGWSIAHPVASAIIVAATLLVGGLIVVASMWYVSKSKDRSQSTVK